MSKNFSRHLRHFQVGSFRMTVPYTLENSSITQICPHTVVSISGTGQAQQDHRSVVLLDKTSVILLVAEYRPNLESET